MGRLAALVLLALPATAAAEVRVFTETYAYATQPEATTSVQLWHTARQITWDRDYPEELEQRIDDVEVDLGWSAGASYQLHDKLRLGAETWGETDDDGPRPPSDDLRVSVGPVVHFAPAPRFWATGTAGFGLTDAADVFAVRVLIGIEL